VLGRYYSIDLLPELFNLILCMLKETAVRRSTSRAVICKEKMHGTYLVTCAHNTRRPAWRAIYLPVGFCRHGLCDLPNCNMLNPGTHLDVHMFHYRLSTLHILTASALSAPSLRTVYKFANSRPSSDRWRLCNSQ
jgi:hypothetical protein